MLPCFESVNLPNRLLQLTEAIETIHNAGHDMEYYITIKDLKSTKAIYQRMKLLDVALINFQRTYGENNTALLED